MRERINIIFNIKDVKIIEDLPDFEYVCNYLPMERMNTHKHEWGRIRVGDKDACLLGFSQFCIDGAAAFDGRESSIEEREMNETRGALRVTSPTLNHLQIAMQMMMHKLSHCSKVYPPDFKIWTETSADGTFVIKYEANRLK